MQTPVEVARRTGEAGLEEDLGDKEGPARVLAGGLDNDRGGAHRVTLALADAMDDAAHASATSSSTAYWSASKIQTSTMAPSRTV